jgi:predicted nucleic acid-binding protein
VADNVDTAVQAFVNADAIALPVIVLGEYRFGIAQSRRVNQYETWLEKVIAASQVLDIDERTSRHYAQLRLELKKQGKPIPANDLWIAALCRQYSFDVLSRDRHFDSVPGVKRLGW